MLHDVCGASDSALMLTMYALQMFVLLLLFDKQKLIFLSDNFGAPGLMADSVLLHS